MAAKSVAGFSGHPLLPAGLLLDGIHLSAALTSPSPPQTDSYVTNAAAPSGAGACGMRLFLNSIPTAKTHDGRIDHVRRT